MVGLPGEPGVIRPTILPVVLFMDHLVDPARHHGLRHEDGLAIGDTSLVDELLEHGHTHPERHDRISTRDQHADLDESSRLSELRLLLQEVDLTTIPTPTPQAIKPGREVGEGGGKIALPDLLGERLDPVSLPRLERRIIGVGRPFGPDGEIPETHLLGEEVGGELSAVGADLTIGNGAEQNALVENKWRILRLHVGPPCLLKPSVGLPQ